MCTTKRILGCTSASETLAHCPMGHNFRAAMQIIVFAVSVLFLAPTVQADHVDMPLGELPVDANTAENPLLFNALTINPSISEDGPGQWAAGPTIVIDAPLGFGFNTAVVPTATVVAGTVVVAAPPMVTANQITFTVTGVSGVASTISFADIQLRVLDCVDAVAGDAADITVTTSAALLNEPLVNVTIVAGPIHHFHLSASLTPQLANDAILMTVTAQDYCNNYVAGVLASDLTITASGAVIKSFNDGNVPNNFTISDPDPNDNTATVLAGNFFDVTGQATFKVTSPTPEGPINVTVTGPTANGTTSVEWIDPSCTLDPATDANLVGTTHTVMVTLLRDGVNPAANETVNFAIIAGPNMGTPLASQTTNASGEASITPAYVSNGDPGEDTIEATGDIGGVPFSCTATKEWVAPTCSLDPVTEVNQVNTIHDVTVTVERRPGVAADSETVDWAITGGPNTGLIIPQGTTNPAGEASFSYISSAIGTDTIQASGTLTGIAGASFLCTATKEWIDPSCSMDPASDVNLIGTIHTVTLTLLRGGVDPAVGETVNFNVTGTNNGESGVDITDASGVATFTYTDTLGPGTDTIVATGNIGGAGGVPFICTATKEWIDPSCSLDPATDTNLVGTEQNVTITLLRDGVNPAGGETVNWEITAGPNTGVYPAGTTDAITGQATFTYIGSSVSGIDTIEATGNIGGVGGVPFICTATKDWVNPSCSLDPATDTNLVSTVHNVTITLLRDGINPAGGETVNFNIPSGPNAGTVDTLITDAITGQATFTYTGSSDSGIDTIEASGIIGGIGGVPFNCTATKEWVNPNCDLDPATDTNLVGTVHNVTLTLRDGVDPAGGEPVNWEITAGPNTGVYPAGTTDAITGQATFTYTSNGISGIDTIEATGDIGGMPFICTATKDWVNPSCSLDPISETILVETEHNVTITLLRDGINPAGGETVDFDITSGPNAGTVDTLITDAITGQATFTYTGSSDSGIDFIEATGSIGGVGGVPFICTATKEWINPSCSLDPVDDTNLVGTTHNVTITLLRDGTDPAVGETVNFNITDGPNVGTNATLITDAITGQATFTYTSDGVSGIDMIEASGNIGGVPFNCAATNEWVDPICALEPITDTALVGTSHTVTVTVNRNPGIPEDGLTMNFAVTTGPNAGVVVAPQDTDGFGQADFTYTSNGTPGTDTIQVSGTIDGLVPFSCIATKEWVDVACGLDPPTAINEIGTSHTVTATVRRNGIPEVGLNVTFDITSGPNVGEPAFVAATDTNGTVDYTYTDTGTGGTDIIEASATISGIPFNCTAQKEWIASECAMDPPAADAVDTDHTVTVTVLRSGVPQADVQVAFGVVNGPNFGDIQAALPTNAIGERSFTYTGDGGQGIDTVEASGVIDGIPFECQTTIEWVDATCSLVPASDTNQVGTAHTVTVTVLRNGVPAQAVNVDFNVTVGPNSGLAGLGVTGVNGEADWIYTSNGNDGTDEIRASGTVDGDPFECTATKVWISSGCILTPATDINQINTNHTVTALVLRNGAPEPGVPVAFEVTAGPNTGDIDTGTSNASGEATFTYTGDDGTGTDTITATGVIEAVPFTATATKEWIDSGCALAPATDTNQVGGTHTVTVTITRNGIAAPGELVTFDITAGPHTGQTDLGVTDAAGQADFTYTSDGNTGTDTIQAAGTVDGVPYVCTATKEWIESACAMAPATDTNQVNTSHTVTATVTRNGNPAEGVNVDFNISAGPNTGKSFSLATDATGQAAFTYTGDGGAGTDTIEATGDVDGVPFASTATKIWQADDNDGIDPDIEDGAPNNGDGNNDGIPDKLQDNVASFLDIFGSYVTIATPVGTTLVNCQALDVPSPDLAPPAATFPRGFFGFELHNVAPGGAADVILYLHGDDTVNTYYKYGASMVIPVAHFYEFLFDGTTGAEINNNIITLHFVDGQRGDDDLTANGIIIEPGGPTLRVDAPLAVGIPPCGLCGVGSATLLPMTLIGWSWIRRGATRRRRRR